MHAHDPAPVEHAVRDRGERLGAPVVDRPVEELTDEPLVRRREQQRVAERGMHCALAQEHRALRRRLAEVEAGVDDDLLGPQPDCFRAPGAFEEERGDVADEVVVTGFGVGNARLQADVRGHHGRVVLRGDRQVVGIAEPGDVVADHRTGGAGGIEYRRPPRVDRDRNVETGAERFDRGHDPIELLVLVHLRPRAGLHATDVEQLCTVGDHRLGARRGMRRTPTSRPGRRRSRACG